MSLTELEKKALKIREERVKNMESQEEAARMISVWHEQYHISDAEFQKLSRLNERMSANSPIYVNSEAQREKAIKRLREMDLNDQTITFKRVRNKRSLEQNNAIHLYCSQLAEKLNEGGFDMKKVMSLKPEVDIPWTMETVKECVWKQVQNAMIKKVSTTALSKVEVSEVYEVMNRFTADRFGISIAFPSRKEIGN